MTAQETPPRPSLCVGMPVYNGEDFIEEALDSLLSQSYSDFEIVVVDNASTDSTPELVERYMARDDRIRLRRNETNLGAAANFNLAFDECDSPYFKWVAIDDPIGPDMLGSCISALEADPDAVLAYPGTAFINEQSELMYAFSQRVTMPDWSHDTVARGRQAFRAILEDGSTANVLVFGVMRSDLLRRARRMGSFFGADLPMMADVVLQGHVIEVPGLQVFLRRHEESSSTYERKPDPRSQQDFYDPSVSGRLRLHWNLRRRYASLLKVAVLAPVGPIGRAQLVIAYVGSVLDRVRWRVDYERRVRRGEKPHDPQWSAPGEPRPHWKDVVGQPQP